MRILITPTLKKLRTLFELKPFQTESARLIADRFAFFARHPDRPRKGFKPRPFFQALSAITGAGKTPILAHAVVEIRGRLASEPIVLWMSKARSVVRQTTTNFCDGGKYHELLEGCTVLNVSDITPAAISDDSTALVIMTTTGLFNDKEQRTEGGLYIYRSDQDGFGNKSPWQRLIERQASVVSRRPLIIVYDEAHNLSPQQTDLLMELEPDAYLLASATPNLPFKFQDSVIRHVTSWFDETRDLDSFKRLGALDKSGSPQADLFITTSVPSGKVVEAQLIKKAIQFDGTTSQMESCLDDMMTRMQILHHEISNRNLQIRPKAIYVCRTNVANDGDNDDHSAPFAQRKAPPIMIWRYLVENKGVAPSDIAIYADLKFFGNNKPEELNLFSKGENDFENFQAGNFQHIIFNLALQEGWDDPECYCAYIDKSMGSRVQVQQLIGRVLRQPGAEHYNNPLLNSAHIFLRVDNQRVFSEAVEAVKKKLLSEGSSIEIVDNFSTGQVKSILELEPRDDVNVILHEVFVDSTLAAEQIERLIDDFPIFAENDDNTSGEAEVATQIVELLDPAATNGSVDWLAGGHTNRVRLRWLATTAVRARSARAAAISKFKQRKFDVRVEMQSRANILVDELATKVAETFFAHAELAYESTQPITFGTIRVPTNASSFSNALYRMYSGLNNFEKPFAFELDKLGVVWHRNPSAGGFGIPLLSAGATSTFYPDFIVWTEKCIFCLDTKAGMLLTDAVARKLFDIYEDGKTRIKVRFITEGKQDVLRGKPIRGGFTIWKSKNGNPIGIYAKDLAKAVQECLR